MQTITTQELVEEINKVVSCQPVSVDIITEPKMRKTDNPYLGTKKSVTINGLIGFNYSNSVNNQLGREDKEMTFVPQPRKWGVLNGNLVYHKEEIYLQIKAQSSSIPVFSLNGQLIDKSVVEPFLYEHTKPHTQDGIDKEIAVRDININNILSIRMLGEEYVIVEFAEDIERTRVPITETVEEIA